MRERDLLLETRGLCLKSQGDGKKAREGGEKSGGGGVAEGALLRKGGILEKWALAAVWTSHLPMKRRVPTKKRQIRDHQLATGSSVVQKDRGETRSTALGVGVVGQKQGILPARRKRRGR